MRTFRKTTLLALILALFLALLIVVAAIVPQNGLNGENGLDGQNGQNGLSAYQIYKKHHPAYEGSEEEWIDALADGTLAASYRTNYNIIFTLATIPPVLSALESIQNGDATYAMIERGKTYNGIDQVPNFHNIGFDISSNASYGFTSEQFEAVVNKIKELNVFGNEKFTIYVQDGTALHATCLVANAMLTDKQYKVVMVEDGTGAYAALQNEIVSYEDFQDAVNAVRTEVDDILKKSNNAFTPYYDIKKAFALSTLDHYEYLLQSSAQVENILNAKGDEDLFAAFGVSEEESDLSAQLRYASISELVGALDDAQKQSYLSLMYGNAYSGTFDALTRTTDVTGAAVPDKKLVFIGTRVRSYPAVASAILGVPAIEGDLPTYAELPEAYKSSLLFPTEQDYALVYDILFDDDQYQDGVGAEMKSRMRIACFNYYVNYIATLKFTYAEYGAHYDIIMKGHPAEPMEGFDRWNYTLPDAELKNYNKLMYSAIIGFHESDSVGRRIGVMPYGTAAENLAYIGVDLSIGGLPSSTYAGYEKTVDVVFVLSNTDGSILTDNNLKVRYEEGSLTYRDPIDQTEKIGKFFNNGLIYKTLAEKSEGALRDRYLEKLSAWIAEVMQTSTPELYDVNEQGFVVEKQ